MQADLLQVKGVNNTILYADQFPGSDIGAKVNTCVSVLNGPGTIVIPPGSYSYSTDIVLSNYQTLASFEAGQQTTTLTYTGTGNAIATAGGNTISGISLTLGTSAAKGFYLKGENIRLQNCWMSGGGAATKHIHVTQFNGTTLSGLVWISHVVSNSFNGTAVTIDHCTGTHLDNVYFQATGANTTGVVIDSGVSDIEMNNCAFLSNQVAGMVIKNSLGGGVNTFNQYPNYLNFHQTIIDSAGSPGIDAILFDSTLSTSPVYIRFVDSWAAGHGNNGLHISGGQGIKWIGGVIRSNGLNGILIDSANVADVQISDSFVTANNTSNNADAHGVYVNAASVRVVLLGNDIGNHLDTTGNQKYGFKVAAVAADDFIAIGNNLKDNQSGYFSDSNTGAKMIVGNSSIPGTSPSWVHGDLHVHGSVFNDAGVFATTLNVNAATPVTSAGSIAFGNTDGFGNGTAGTAMTTTTKGTGSGPATPQTVVKYLKINDGGTDYWVPLVQ